MLVALVELALNSAGGAAEGSQAQTPKAAQRLERPPKMVPDHIDHNPGAAR
ncbi:MAG: hypothetical protein M3Q91_04260 [Acidobacteriota bacterium]|nr:hypothetical protein [Acidobacteriota bacterium]